MIPSHVSTREVVNWVFIITIVFVGPLLAYSLPDKIATDWSWVHAFVEFMAGLVPSINKIVVISTFPDSTRMFLSIQWAVIGPIFVFLFAKYYTITPLGIAMVRPMLRRWHKWILPFALIGLLYVFIFLPLNGSPPYVGNSPIVSIIRLMGESRLWLGVFGSTHTIVTAFFFVAFFKLPAIYREIYSNRNISEISHGADK